jgi:hypothetical protein
LRNCVLFFVILTGLAASAWGQAAQPAAPAPQAADTQTTAPKATAAAATPASDTQEEIEPRAFPRFNFNVGGGQGIGRGAVGGFVGNTPFGVAGAGVNFSKMFGVSAEYMFYNLSMRQSVRNSQSLPQGTGSLQSVSLNGILRLPYHAGRWGFYGIFGVGYYRRSMTSSSKTITPGSLCQPAWVWWDIYCVGSPEVTPPLSDQSLASFTKDAGGYNFGGGATFRLNHWHNSKMYFEYRFHKAYSSDVQSVVWPLTIGLRW